MQTRSFIGVYDFKNYQFLSDNIAMRGERLELLINKTENLTNNVSINYKNCSCIVNV